MKNHLLIILALALLLAACGKDTKPPTSPTDLRVFNPTADSLTVIWNGATDYYGISGYNVNRNGVMYLTTAAMGFTDSGLLDASMYCYQVSAIDSAGNTSAFTPHTCGTTLSGAPIPPVYITNTVFIMNTVSITNTTFQGSDILNTTFINTNIDSSAFINSGIVNSSIVDCLILNSTIFNSPLFGNTVSGRTIVNATIFNSPGIW